MAANQENIYHPDQQILDHQLLEALASSTFRLDEDFEDAFEYLANNFVESSLDKAFSLATKRYSTAEDIKRYVTQYVQMQVTIKWNITAQDVKNCVEERRDERAAKSERHFLEQAYYRKMSERK